MTLELIPHLVRLTAWVVRFDEPALRAFAAEHAAESASVELRETLLQAHLFCGFPRTLAALDTLRGAGLSLSEPAVMPPRLPLDEDLARELERERARGAELFDRIYGDGADGVRAHLVALDPAFARWIGDHAYGRVLSRPALAASTRELLAVAALVATGHDRQLASHVRGAVRCGARPEDVVAVLDAIAEDVPAENMERARQVASRFAQ